MKIRLALSCVGIFFTSILGCPVADATVLLHSTMDDANSIYQPLVAAASYATMAEAVPGPSHVVYEPGVSGSSARFDGNGFSYQWPVDGPVRFHGDNFDFDDPEQDGGRLDFWIKFNVDPHTTYANTWVARSNWGQRYINYEFSGSPADLMVDVYSDIAHNERTNYKKFRVGLRNWSVYENIQAGEWHQITLTWRNNGVHKDELHIYIDGTQAGCHGCNDYNGNLPPVGSITDFFFSPALFDQYILFSIDEVYSFDSWDVSGYTGNFADLQIPEGVTLKYPMDNRYPTWGMTVPTNQLTFEFQVALDEPGPCDCDLYVDGSYVASATTTDLAHTEISHPTPLANGLHTWQVRCDDDRLVSPVNQFNVVAATPTPVPVAGGSRVWLSVPSPNPSSGLTKFEAQIPVSGPVQAMVYDAAGRRVRRLVDETWVAGTRLVHWDGRDDQGQPAASGTYHLRLMSSGQVSSRPLILLR